MSAYLQIAEAVLESARRPLSAKAILRKGHLARIVPDHLYGKTQHKTLQARLSEDILHRRDQSAFFRTKPGQFFLRKFITDTSLPPEFRQPISARRRTRDMLRGPALTLHSRDLQKLMAEGTYAAPSMLARVTAEGLYSYVDPKRVGEDDVLVWAIAALVRRNQVLCYRTGRYRDNRDEFARKRTVGFSSLVLETDRTLFDLRSLGIADSALFAASIDLDIPVFEASVKEDCFPHSVKFLTWSHSRKSKTELLAFVEVHAPDWFEPKTSKLSLNDVHWMDLRVPPNNFGDFDPWSQTVLNYYYDKPRLYE